MYDAEGEQLYIELGQIVQGRNEHFSAGEFGEVADDMVRAYQRGVRRMEERRRLIARLSADALPTIAELGEF